MKMLKLCTALVLVMNLTSCGKMPQFGNLMERWATEKNKESFDALIKQKYLHCSRFSYARACTNSVPRAELMQPYEFFGPYCHQQYLSCLNSN